MSDAKNVIDDLFDMLKHTSGYNDTVMVEIMKNRKKYENNLNEMWAAVPRIGMPQMMEYRKAVEEIKSAGLKVLRNPAGDHKIAYKD